jgi:hypothetical protein
MVLSSLIQVEKIIQYGTQSKCAEGCVDYHHHGGLQDRSTIKVRTPTRQRADVRLCIVCRQHLYSGAKQM